MFTPRRACTTEIQPVAKLEKQIAKTLRHVPSYLTPANLWLISCCNATAASHRSDSGMLQWKRVAAIADDGELNMSPTAEQILSTFDRLSAVDQQLVAAEILRRINELECPPVSDEELTLAAERLFLELDEAES